MTLDELEAEAKKLDPTSRAALISRLSASLAALQNAPSNSSPAAPAAAAPPPQTDEQKEREWLQEALRRSRELRERQIQTEPPDRRPTAPAEGSAMAMKEPKPAHPKPVKLATARPKPKSKPAPRKKSAPKKRAMPKPRPRARPRPKPRPKKATTKKARPPKRKRR